MFVVVVMPVVSFMRVVVMRSISMSMVRMGSISLFLFVDFPMFFSRSCVLAVLFASWTVAAGIEGQGLHAIDVNTLFNDLSIGIAPMGQCFDYFSILFSKTSVRGLFGARGTKMHGTVHQLKALLVFRDQFIGVRVPTPPGQSVAFVFATPLFTAPHCFEIEGGTF